MSIGVFYNVLVDGITIREGLQYHDLMEFVNGKLRNCIVQGQHVEIKPHKMSANSPDNGGKQ